MVSSLLTSAGVIDSVVISAGSDAPTEITELELTVCFHSACRCFLDYLINSFTFLFLLTKTIF